MKMEPLIFKPGWRQKLSDGFMYLVGFVITAGLLWFGLNYFLGESGIYGVKTFYLFCAVVLIIAIVEINMILTDAKLRIEILGDQIRIFYDNNWYDYPIKSSGFSFGATHSDRTGSSYSLYLTDSEGIVHLFDLSPLGGYEFERLKNTIAQIQDLPPNQIVTEEE